MFAYGFETSYEEGNTAYEMRMTRMLHLTRCNLQGSIYLLTFIRCVFIMTVGITIMANAGMYADWKSEGKENDPAHVIWLLRGENMIALLFFTTEIVAVFSAIAATSDGSSLRETTKYPFVQKLHWFLIVNCIALIGAMFISYFAWVRIGATEQSFAVGLQLVIFICMIFETLIGLHSLQLKAVVYPLFISTVVMIILLLIQRNDVYVIYPQFKHTHEGVFACFVFLFMIVAWYVPLSLIVRFGKDSIWQKSETEDEKKKREAQERVELARVGNNTDALRDAEEQLNNI